MKSRSLQTDIPARTTCPHPITTTAAVEVITIITTGATKPI
ncbi:MAG: hypothetical protein ACOYJK_10295 [Prevotella sp.]